MAYEAIFFDIWVVVVTCRETISVRSMNYIVAKARRKEKLHHQASQELGGLLIK
jgi:hypothetical protein